MQKAKTILKPDFCVIGGGSGGLSFAAGASQMGASVVLLEAKKMGGDCLNYGCIPSKALISAAKIGHKILESECFGWSTTKAKVDFEKVHEHIHNVISSIAPHDAPKRFESLGVQVFLEKGKFIDHETIETDTYVIKAKRFIIATGSIPFIPPIKGLESCGFYTNESIFDLTKLPSHLVVIGGGPIGIEMAQAFRRLGSNVTVLESFLALPKDDPDITNKLKSILIQEGLELDEHVMISEVRQDKKSIQVEYQTQDGTQKTIKASHVLVATGRRPNIQDLNLEVSGIKYSIKGIEVDKHLKTTNPRVYAIGDCTGGYQFTHVAGYHAGIAIRNTLFKLRTKIQTQAIPWVTYTDPELAHVGFLESQLKDQKIPYKILNMSFNNNDRAQTKKRTEGEIKILVSPKGYVLGATILEENAGELIYPWVMAIQNKLKLSAIASSIAPYPTLNDMTKRIAGSFYAEKIFNNNIVKKSVRFIMRWFT